MGAVPRCESRRCEWSGAIEVNGVAVCESVEGGTMRCASTGASSISLRSTSVSHSGAAMHQLNSVNGWCRRRVG